VGIGEFGAIACAKTTPNGITFTCASIATTSCICLSLIILIDFLIDFLSQQSFYICSTRNRIAQI
jgi:hypothetical protein